MQGRWFQILSPLVCLGLLGGMLVQKSTEVTPLTAEPYHARARGAIEAVPWRVDGRWAGKERKLPDAAVKLLRPNAYLCREYVDTGAVDPRQPSLSAMLLIVQCKVSGDMVGHYPKNCYPSAGWELTRPPAAFTRTVAGIEIPATEYHFRKTERGVTETQCVYNFLIVPGTGIVPDIKGVERAAEDYQDRYFGAAQFQVVMSDVLGTTQREQIYQTLVGACAPTIRALIEIPAAAAPTTTNTATVATARPLPTPGGER